MPTNSLSIQAIGTVQGMCKGKCAKNVQLTKFENGVVQCPHCKTSYKPQAALAVVSEPMPSLPVSQELESAPCVWCVD